MPPVMMTLVFLCCSIVVTTRYYDWELAEYAPESVLLLLLGILTYILGGIIAYSLVFLSLKPYSRMNTSSDIEKRINIPSCVIIIGIVVCVVTLVLLVEYIKNIVVTMNYNHSSFAKLLYSFRVLSARQLIPQALIMPWYLRILSYGLEIFPAFALFVLLHNVMFKCFRKKDLLLMVILALGIGQMILFSERGKLLNLMAVAVYLIYLYKGARDGFNWNTTKKVMRAGFIMMCCFLVVFFAFAVFQNRISKTNTKFNVATIYIGGGIRAFDLFVKDPVSRNTGILGNDETWPYPAMLLSAYLGIGERPVIPLEFRSINGKNIGNIYTAFRRYYSDFSIAGLVFFSAFLGFLMTYLYACCKRLCIYGKSGFVILLFAWLSRTIFFMPIEEYFFPQFISLNGFYKIGLLYMLYVIFAERRILEIFRYRPCKHRH